MFAFALWYWLVVLGFTLGLWFVKAPPALVTLFPVGMALIFYILHGDEALRWRKDRADRFYINCPICHLKIRFNKSLILTMIAYGLGWDEAAWTRSNAQIYFYCKICGADVLDRYLQARPVQRLLEEKKRGLLHRKLALEYNQAIKEQRALKES